MTTKIRQQNGITIVEPSGKIVGLATSELRKALSPQIMASDPPRILINFAHVNKIDSSGLGALMEARALTTRKRGRLGVVNVGKQIKSLIVLNRLVRHFEHFENENTAISALAS